MHRSPPVADHHTSLWTAWTRLRGPEQRHLVVIDAQVRPLGVLEEHDLALAWPPGPLGAQRVPLRRLVRGYTPRVRDSDDLAAVARTMLAADTEAVPVVDHADRLLGLITARRCIELLACRALV
ncbi:CBS domain-containing protein [Geodermatophilus sp. YIM 151500]|uniref:CBS domain-containing protein n=1 Tax=Geodermatophilus sp. YIM 151500 TaxID=2984531 RepID=UPI0021E4D122|nr:CBS domain-containing protein [Geodermatophilus sp. YIM 151500]MCV2489801.1 CBS domain-containing protein [Geodermatophilus sp. YIM 151500]